MPLLTQLRQSDCQLLLLDGRKEGRKGYMLLPVTLVYLPLQALQACREELLFFVQTHAALSSSPFEEHHLISPLARRDTSDHLCPV